ncbi:hypothetical protein PPROV_000370800 [Pycnococcus provasolii]|uniref:2Fe-2S ferredoxin-type domain-containing protein n=2 Tax=Pycnococcus provasolii TaxID=41880 RepID=A0A830HC69_9CHLO|nr:hypothetical protein PPROV_000370800 [Pycnococcus provasolii]
MLMNGLSPHNEGARTINCRGLGTCGTCAVRVLDGRVEPATWTQKERLRLNFPPHGPPTNQKLRLACQVRLCAGQDVTLQKMGGFWGSTDEPAPEPPPFTAPLGPLEFALDRDSWGSRPAGQDNKK